METGVASASENQARDIRSKSFAIGDPHFTFMYGRKDKQQIFPCVIYLTHTQSNEMFALFPFKKNLPSICRIAWLTYEQNCVNMFFKKLFDTFHVFFFCKLSMNKLFFFSDMFII